MGQGREERWELHLQNEVLSILELIFGRLQNRFISNVGVELCRGFKHAHMLVFYHPPPLPSLCFHLSPFSSYPVVRNPLLTAPAVCLLFMSNVSVAGSPHKAASIDWKTIQFSLARLAARCGLGFVV